MGIAESKMLAESLISACHRAEREGKDRLDETRFWKDVNMIKVSKSIYRYIPRDIRCNSRQPAIRKAIARSSRQIKVPQVVQDLQDKRESLFAKPLPTYSADCAHGSPIASQSSPIPTPTTSSVSSLAESYDLVIHCERQQDLGKIRLRLLYVSYFRLKDAMQPVTQYHYYDAATFIAQVIKESGVRDDSLDVIQRRVRRWIGLGERYSLLANDLGGLGALYILPHNGGESIWTKELPKSSKNPNRIAMIENLRRQGLPENAQNRDLHKSAEYEIAQIWGPMKASLDLVLERQLSETNYQRAARSQLNGSDEIGGSHSQSDLPQTYQPSTVMSSEAQVSLSLFTKPGIPPSQIGTAAMQTTSSLAMQMNVMQSDEACSGLVQDTSRPSYDHSSSHASLENQSEFIMPQVQPGELTPNHIPPGSIPCDSNVLQRGDLTAAGSAHFSIEGNNQSHDCPNTLHDMRASTATITPADFPQAFALTSTMVPADYPQLFPYHQGTVTPADYPQMFPCDPTQYVGSSNYQPIVQLL